MVRMRQLLAARAVTGREQGKTCTFCGTWAKSRVGALAGIWERAKGIRSLRWGLRRGAHHKSRTQDGNLTTILFRERNELRHPERQ